MRIFKCLLRDTLRLLLRHWGVSLLTFLTASAVFFLVGASALLLVNLRSMVQKVEEGLVIQAYVKKVEDLQTLRASVEAIPGVARVEAVSPEEALRRLGATLEGHMQALEILGENPSSSKFRNPPFPGSLRFRSGAGTSGISPGGGRNLCGKTRGTHGPDLFLCRTLLSGSH